ncbi:hypothetical protein BSIN_3748 [Burkholderia singularis]|uniref:Uncharacterized protein n=1 Tax=Burkholderia singularis TaxID=1503053 RepID=A0A238H603_9BURK|nr:hypothetical protein BSIN_3748 [Burkholderia singularis]
MQNMMRCTTTNTHRTFFRTNGTLPISMKRNWMEQRNWRSYVRPPASDRYCYRTTRVR